MSPARCDTMTPAVRCAIRGFTITEVLIASLIAAVVAGGTMMSFVTAARITRAKSNVGTAEASNYARETAEKYRNYIACDSPWFNATTCAPTGGLPTTWQEDALPAPDPLANSESILIGGASRRFCVTAKDCDGGGVGGPGNCYAIQVKVCWGGSACPAIGDPCP